MNTFSIKALTAVCLVVFVGTCFGDSTTDSGSTDSTPIKFPIDCKPFHLKSMKILLKTFNRCSRELKTNVTNDKDYEENIGCAMKCTMRKLGYTEENNLVTISSIRQASSNILPVPALVEIVTQWFLDKCHAKYGSLLNPDEPQCRSYSEYAFCVQSTIGDLVDSDYCIKEPKKAKDL